MLLGGLLRFVPLLDENISLPENLRHQMFRNIAAVRIGDADLQSALSHVGMPSPGMRAVKSELLELANQVSPGNVLRHALPTRGGRSLF